MNDELSHVALFQIDMVPKWSEKVVHFFTITKLRALRDTIIEQMDFMLASSRFQMIADQLYYLGQDNFLRLVAYLEEYKRLLS